MTQTGRRRIRLSAVAAAGLALLLAAGFVALGVWQLERRAWKLDLIERVEARVAAEPVGAPSDADGSALDPDRFEYLRIAEDGRFLEGEALVRAVTIHGSGYWVLSPFATEDGRTILVNRGFVPQEARDTERPIPEETTRLRGLLRLSEPDGGFLRDNDPAAGRWYSRDVAAIADALGLDPANVAPFFVDAEEGANGTVGEGGPIGGLTVIRFRNSHMVYALTWFALAAMAVGASVLVLRTARVPEGETEHAS